MGLGSGASTVPSPTRRPQPTRTTVRRLAPLYEAGLSGVGRAMKITCEAGLMWVGRGDEGHLRDQAAEEARLHRELSVRKLQIIPVA